MRLEELEISGSFLCELNCVEDARGSFVKYYHTPSFEGTPLAAFELEEEFYTTSNKNVLRGLHFQIPPAAHDKIVTCISGSVLDFFLDIRTSSSTYGKVVVLELDSSNPQFLYLTKGIAHGFLAKEDGSLLLYKTNKAYDPKCDKGIHWESIQSQLCIDAENVMTSERDSSFESFLDFRSPFR